MSKISLNQTHAQLYQRGFTLLELLVVITLLGLLSLSTIAIVDNVDEQERFETTRTRLQQIRTAIIGDASLSLNGEPMLSGFVVDMGRLPECVKELVVQEECGSATALPDWAAQDVEVSGVSPGKIYGGWRGPYLQVMPEIGGAATFRDGWGNADAVSAVDADDFGWNVVMSGVEAIDVQSLGLDGAAGGVGQYAQDYPAAGNLVTESDWLIDLSGVSPAFKIKINGTVDDTTGNKLAIFYINDGTASSLTDAIKSQQFDVVSGVTTQMFEIGSAGSSKLPMGRMVAVVLCSDDTVFDGHCPGTNLAVAPVNFTLLPRANIFPIEIEWNLD